MCCALPPSGSQANLRHVAALQSGGSAAAAIQTGGKPPRGTTLVIDAALGLVFGPALAALDALPGPYAWKFNLMRLRRQLAWSKIGGW